MQNEYLKYFSTGFDKMQQIQMEYYVFFGDVFMQLCME